MDFSAATIQYQGVACPVVRVGALLSTKNAAPTLNTAGATNVTATVLLDATATTCSYAVRLQNIPDSAVGTTVYARPYYVIQYQGQDTVVYGTVDATTYQKNRK